MARHEPTDKSLEPSAVSWDVSKLLASEAAACGLMYLLYRQGGWRDVWKFLSGAFFVSAGTLYYLAGMGVSVPILGTGYVESPKVSGRRAIAHTVFCAVCLYLGFIRKAPRR